MKIPKTGNILIPGIAKEVEKKLKELNLIPHVSPRKFLKIYKKGKHRYFSVCEDKKGEKVVFYSRFHFNLDAKEKITREIKFLKKIKKENLKIKKIIPELISYGKEKKFEWFIRKYPVGKSLNQWKNLTKKLKENNVPKIIKIILEISKIPPNFLQGLKKFEIKNYLGENNYESLVKRKIIEKDLASLIQHCIKEHFSFLKRENKYFSHGDLNLGNIIFDGKNIFLIDWELIHLNNFAYDIGYLWSNLWKEKREIRQKMLFEYMRRLSQEKKEKFKILFPIVVSFLASSAIKFKEKNLSLRKKRRKFFSAIFENFFDFEKLIKL